MKITSIFSASLAACLGGNLALGAAYHMPKTPFSGSLYEPISALYMIAENQGYAAVDKALSQLEAQYGESLVALGTTEYKGEATVYATHYYQKREDGSLKPVATVTGYTVGGDETTASTPGRAVIELNPTR